MRGRAKLDGDTLEIDVTTRRRTVRTVYLVEPLDPDPSIGWPAIRLWKLKDRVSGELSGEVYDIIMRKFGGECSCPDFDWRGRDGGCKHVASLRVVGLLRGDG